MSSSALRGVSLVGESSIKVRIHLEQNDLPVGFFTGYTFLLLDDPQSLYEVTGFQADSSTLELNQEADLNESGNLPFELRSPEEAPILGRG